MIGTPNIMANVSRSRPSWRTSLVMMAPSRRRKPVGSSIERIVACLSHEMDEDVFERGLGLLPFDRGIGAPGFYGLEQRLAVGAADMQRRAEGRRGCDTRRIAQLHRQPVGAWARCDEGDEAGGLDDLFRRAAR